MTAPTTSRKPPRRIPARPSWRRLTVLVSLLLLGWAALLPAGQAPHWWHYLLAAALILAFVGSWQGQHTSTVAARWAPMAWRNRRRRSRRPGGTTEAGRPDPRPRESQRPAATQAGTLQAHIVIHLRPHPHALATPTDSTDQLPWQFVTAWLNRYGVRADALTVCSVTRTPPLSGLRSDSAALLGGRNTQHHDTWLTYTLRAENNVGALTARRTTVGIPEGAGPADDAAQPHRVTLADTTARRLIAELRELGWLATLTDDADQLPPFVPPAATIRRETWTGAEYSDGFRAVYAVEAGSLSKVLQTLPALNTKATWMAVTVRSQGRQPLTVQAAVATLTAARPPRHPLDGLHGFHGSHRQIAPSFRVTGLDAAAAGLPVSQVTTSDLAALRWPTAAAGVPIGFNRARQPVYLGLASPEPVRITVTGTHEFHVGMIARLALSGLPVALYTAESPQWTLLANHGGPQQFSRHPTTTAPDSIVVGDGSTEISAGAITVTLRLPQSAPAPSTTIVITQDDRRPGLFYITTAHGRQWLSTRLTDGSSK